MLATLIAIPFGILPPSDGRQTTFAAPLHHPVALSHFPSQLLMSSFNFDQQPVPDHSAESSAAISTDARANSAATSADSVLDQQSIGGTVAPATEHSGSGADALDHSLAMPPPPTAATLFSPPSVANSLPAGATVTAVVTADNTIHTPKGLNTLRSPPSANSTSTSRSTSPTPFQNSPTNSSGMHRSFSRTVSLSPIDLFAHVDPRYPDIIATLSNALHFLNKTGFDHDQVHEHITAQQLAEFEQQTEVDDDISDDVGLKRRDATVRVDTRDEAAGVEGDDLLTPEDSESSCSSDEEGPHHIRNRSDPAIVPPTNGSASAARRSRREEQESFPPATPDVQTPTHGAAGMGPVLPEHSSTAPMNTHRTDTSTNRFDEPAAGSSAGSSHASVNKEYLSSYRSSSPQPPLPPSPPNQRQTSQDDSNLPDENNEKRSSGGLFGHRHHHVHSSRHHHHRRKTMDTRYLSPGSNEATALQQHYPTIAHSSPKNDQQPDHDNDREKNKNSNNDKGSPNHPQMDVKEDTKTEVTEQVDHKENDDSVVTTVTTITTTVHTLIKTTTVPKTKGAVVTAAQSPETAVVWTPTEQSQLLEEILIFYVDLYWENQTSFAPFYKRKLDTWNDKALMIYRHLFQDEKFKSDTKKFLKEPLVEFYEEQLIHKSGQRIGRSGALQPPAGVKYQASPSSTNSSHDGAQIGGVHFGHLFMPSPSPASTTQQHNELSVSGPSSTSPQPSPSSLAPPSTGTAPRRRSSFSLPSLPNPLAAFFSSSSDKTTPPAELDETGLYLQRANNVCTDLHTKYRAVTRTIQQLVSNQILAERGCLPPSITNADELNRAVATILCSRDVLQLLSEYHPAYQTAVVDFPGRVLMSRTLRHRIESLAYMPINFTDLIVGVNEITEILRKCFQKIARLHPDMIQKLVASKRLKTLREIHYNQRKDKAGYPDSFSAWLYESRVYPKLFGADTYELLKQVGWCDARTFHLISEHRLQEALWRLKELNRDKESEQLERLIFDKILGDEAANVSGVENLGGGFTTTKLINFPSQDIRGVYKPDHGTITNPKDWKLQTLKDSIVSNYKKEIAAYKIDQLLKINHVPITKQTNFHGEIGSLQYFISDATVARAVNDIDIKNPTKAGKWTTANGRTELPRTIKMYDWFINNRDRNLDNYLLADDGRIILIDHGWTFVAPPTNPSSQFLKSIIPREQVYNNVKAVYDNQPLIDNELGDLLGKGNLGAFKNRLKTFVNFVEKRIAKKGRAETFRVPNLEDWLPVLD